MLLIFTLLLFLNGMVYSQGEDPFIEKGVQLIAFRDSINNSYFSRTIDDWKKTVHFNGYIESPLENTKFYFYRSNWVSPNPSHLLCSYADTMIFIPPGRPDIDSSTILFLQERILQEPEFDKQKLYRFAYFFSRLQDLRYDSVKVLNSWKDIKYHENDTVSAYIKSVIKPLSITYSNPEYKLIFYTWAKYTRSLTEVIIRYRQKRIIVNSRELGKFGVRYYFM